MELVFLLVAAAAHPAGSAGAPPLLPLVAPVHQNRYVTAFAATDEMGGDGDSESVSDSAQDFGPFQSQVTASASSYNADASTDAWQDSGISVSGLTLAGGTETGGCGSGVFGATVEGEGTSYFEVRFTLTASAAFTAVGMVGADGGDASVLLRTGGGSLVFDATASGHAGDVPIDESGMLPAGDYRVIASAAVDDSGKCVGGSADFSLDIDFQREIGATFCSPAVPNSTGLPGVLRVVGSPTVLDDDLTLIAEDLPAGSNIGYFLMGTGTNTFTPPGSAGPICISPGLQRYLPPVSNTNETPGGFERVVGTTGPVSGLITPGSTWNFQAWHRDGADPSNFTNAVSVSFQ